MAEKTPARRTTGRPETRAAILRAAEHIFAEQGLAGARTDAIAVAAGVNKALIYYYFKSKDALFVAVIEEHLKDFHEKAFAILSSEEPVREKVLHYVGMHFDFIAARKNYPRLFQRFMMSEERPFMQVRRKYVAPVAKKFQAVIEEGIRAGELCASDSTHTAISLVALTVFYFAAAPLLKAVSIIKDPYEKSQLAKRKKEVLNFVSRALFPNGRAGSA
ncbi:MAG: TetR/AcrR family transcriptional regulator [Acidobacteriota bacterium]